MEPELTQILNPLTAEAKRGVPCVYYLSLNPAFCIILIHGIHEAPHLLWPSLIVISVYYTDDANYKICSCGNLMCYGIKFRHFRSLIFLYLPTNNHRSFHDPIRSFDLNSQPFFRGDQVSSLLISVANSLTRLLSTTWIATFDWTCLHLWCILREF